MNKKIIVIFILLISILELIISPVVLAIDKTTLPNPGMMPDRPFYFLKTWWEEIMLFLTIDPIKKAEKLLNYSEKRLAETEKMVEKGKIKYVNKLMERYQKQINKTMEILKKQEEQKKNVEEQMKKVINATSKHIQILNRVLNQAPEAAKKGIENAISASQKGHQQAIQSVSKKRFEEFFKKLKLPERLKIETEKKE